MNELKNYETACQELTNKFIQKYFERDFEDCYDFWVGNEIGGCLSIGDYFFSMDHIVEAMRLNAPVRKFFKYYDYCMDQHMDNKPVEYNLKNFLKIDEKKGNKNT